MSQEIIERTFEVSTPARLSIDNISGSIDIRPGDEGQITVKASKHLNKGNQEFTRVEMNQEGDDHISIATRFENISGIFFGGKKPCRVDFVVRVPQSCWVRLGCVSSPVTVQGLVGEFVFKTVSGNIKLKNLEGLMDITSVSGRIDAEYISGDLDIDNVSSKVNLVNSRLPQISGNTVSGHMIFETPLAEGPYEFKSVSGNVTLLVPKDTACNLSTKSLSGQLNFSLPGTRIKKKGPKWQAKVQGGGPEVIYKSVSGNLNIKSSDNGFDPKEVNETSLSNSSNQTISSSDQTPMTVLERIERGEISVEEALKTLIA